MTAGTRTICHLKGGLRLPFMSPGWAPGSVERLAIPTTVFYRVQIIMIIQDLVDMTKRKPSRAARVRLRVCPVDRWPKTILNYTS